MAIDSDTKRGVCILIPGFLAFCAWVISIWSNFLCDSVRYTLKDDLSNIELPADVDIPQAIAALPLDEYPEIGMGLWSHFGWTYYINYYGQLVLVESCVSYGSGVYRDAMWKTAQAFAIIAFTLGFIAMFVNCAVVFAADEGASTKGKMKKLSAFYFFICVCQGLTILQLSSNFCTENPVGQSVGGTGDLLYNNPCVWSSGIKLNITATCLYFCAALGCWFMPGGDGSSAARHAADDDDVDSKQEDEQEDQEEGAAKEEGAEKENDGAVEVES